MGRLMIGSQEEGLRVSAGTGHPTKAPDDPPPALLLLWAHQGPDLDVCVQATSRLCHFGMKGCCTRRRIMCRCAPSQLPRTEMTMHDPPIWITSIYCRFAKWVPMGLGMTRWYVHALDVGDAAAVSSSCSDQSLNK